MLVPWRVLNIKAKRGPPKKHAYTYDFIWSHVENIWYESIRDAVDGQNPAPVEMVNIPLFTRFYTSQVVQDFVRQPYDGFPCFTKWHIFFGSWTLIGCDRHQLSKPRFSRLVVCSAGYDIPYIYIYIQESYNTHPPKDTPQYSIEYSWSTKDFLDGIQNISKFKVVDHVSFGMIQFHKLSSPGWLSMTRE